MIRGHTFRTGNALQGETQAEGKRLRSPKKLWSGESSTPTAQNYAPSKLAVCDDRPGLGQLPARLGSLPACRTTARDAEDRSRMCSGLTTTTDDQNHGTCVTMLTCRRIAIRCPRSTEPAEEESLLKKQIDRWPPVEDVDHAARSLRHLHQARSPTRQTPVPFASIFIFRQPRRTRAQSRRTRDARLQAVSPSHGWQRPRKRGEQ